MKRRITMILVIAIVLSLAILGVAKYYGREDIANVETTRVVRQDISSVVTASGEIKPKTIVSVGRNANEPIVHLYVREGDRVKKGQKLAELESAQAPFEIKSVYTAKIDGIVTNLPLHDGEAISTGAFTMPNGALMNIADPTVVTAEVRVDETDILKIKAGQTVEVTVDALPDQIFKGKVREIGQNAIIRSTGLSVSQSVGSTQEARDFKVVVIVTGLPHDIRSGLSATAKITTGFAHKVLTVPISALTTRTRGALQAAKSSQRDQAGKDDTDIVGVFVVNSARRAEFRAVKTGLSGATDVEIKEGLQEGEEIIAGSYRVLRTLRVGTKVNAVGSRIDISE